MKRLAPWVVLLALGAHAQILDGEESEWFCDTQLTSREGEFSTQRCPGMNPYACYERLTEVCIGAHTNRRVTRQYREYLPLCRRTAGDCW